MFTALVTLAVAAVAIAGYRRRVLSIGGAAVGAVAFLLGTVGTVVATSLLWIGLRALNADYQVLLVGTYQTDFNVIGITLAAIAMMAALYIALQRRVRWESLVTGAAIVWTLLLWGATLALPGISYLLLWPLAFGLLPLAWAVFVRDAGARPWVRVTVLVVALLPSVMLLPGTAYQVVALLNRMDYMAAMGEGIPLLGVWALFIAPLVALALPQIRILSGDGSRLARWAVPLAAGLAAVVVFGWGMATSGFDSEHPRPNSIAYEFNADAGTARWVSLDPALDGWTTQFFPGGAARGDYEVDQGVSVRAHVAPAPVVAIEQVGIEVVSDAEAGGVRTVTFRLDSPREAAQLDVAITGGTEMTSAAINGQPLDLTGYAPAGEGTLEFGYAGVTAAGVEVTLASRSAEPLRIKVSETTFGLPQVPGMTIQPRPDDTMPATGIPLDATVVRKTFTV